MMGSKAVAERGIASVIHQIAISRITAAIRVTRGFAGSSSTKSNIEIKTNGPSHSPNVLRNGISTNSVESFSAVFFMNFFVLIIDHLQTFKILLLENSQATDKFSSQRLLYTSFRNQDC